MASDELIQSLGFDASSALETLKLLDSGFQTFEGRLNSVGASFTSFNRNAGKTVAALKQITSNAKSAATALQKLNTTPATVAASGGTVASPQQLAQSQVAATAMGNALNQTARNANAATAAVNNLGTNAANSMQRARRATSGFAVSFETLVRVVSTQVIVRALSSLRRAIEDSFRGNLDFVRSMAEIQTLETGSTIEEIGRGVRELSDSFNIPLLEAAAGHFEVLQNGFTGAGERLSVFTAATKFSKTAVASFDDSISLISGTLNAFGKDASEAELIAAKLFRTVDQGKVVGSELARGLGRIEPVGAELGVTLDEMLAALSAITIAGVPSAEALTQIRSSMTALIKPSSAAKEALRELGFENANQLVRAKGLVGAFQALISTTDGQTNSIAKLFPNVRALNGILRLTGTGLEDFQAHLEGVAATDLAQFGDIFAKRISTEAEEVEKSLTKLKNFFTTELGQELVKSLNNIFKFIGGVDTLIDALRAMAPALAATALALGSFGIAAGAVSVATKLNSLTFAAHIPMLTNVAQGYLGAANAAKAATIATSTLQGVVFGFFAILGAQATGKFLGERFVSVLEEAGNKFDETQDKIIERLRSSLSQQLSQTQKANSEIIRGFESLVSEKRKLYFKDVENAKTSNDQLIADSRSVLDRITGAFEEHARRRAKTAQDLAKAVIDSQQRQGDVEKNLEDRRFEFQNRRFDQVSQAIRLQQRAEQIASDAASALSSATRPEQRDAALDDFRRAQAAADQALSIADQTDNLGLRLRAERAIESVMQKQIAAEKQLQQIAEEERKKAEADAAKAEERVKKLNQAAEEFIKKSNFFDDRGQPLAGDQIAKQRQEAEAALQRFFDLSAEGGREIQISDLFAFDQLTSKINSSVTQAEIQNLSVAPQALAALEQQITGAVANLEVIVNLVPNADALRGLSALEGFQAASAQVKGLEDQATALTQRLNEVKVLRETALRRAGVGGGAIEADFDIGAIQPLLKLSQLENNVLGQFADDFFRLKQEMVEAGANAQFTQEQLNALLARVGELQTSAPGGLFGIVTEPALNDLSRALARLQEVVAIRERLKTEFSDVIDGSAEARLNEVNAQLQTIGSAIPQASASTSQLARGMAQVAANAERAAAAAERLGAASAASSVEQQALGGSIRRFNSGGFAPHGTDTVPAMLSPGEFVVNARSSRQFFSELQAINSGRPPVFREDGGPVTNVNVGDINVHSDTRNGNAVGRDVVQAVRREFRRNASRL